MVPNFPINVNSPIVGSIVYANFNSDLEDEIVFATEDGNMHIININGEGYQYMPIQYPFSYYSSPLIYDIDNDNDLEIIAGTSLSINVLDIIQLINIILE